MLKFALARQLPFDITDVERKETFVFVNDRLTAARSSGRRCWIKLSVGRAMVRRSAAQRRFFGSINGPTESSATDSSCEEEITVEAKRVLLVSTEPEDKFVDCLRHANCFVMKANNGGSALVFAKHVVVDAFVLVSTGEAMGRTETALNLRDIRPSSEIILVAKDHDKPTAGEDAAKAIPYTRVLTRQELRNYLAPSEL
jgi:hypothetical protein